MLGSGYDYYVDSINGDDGNNGLTPATAFQTIDGLPSLSDGVRIKLLGAASHWREELAIPANAVVVGEGGILDASDVLLVGDISKTGGRTNVYEFTKTLPAFGAGNAYMAMWEDDTRYVRVASEALCDSTAGSLFPSTDDGGSTVFKFHAIGSANPTSDGKTREYTARAFGLNAATSDGVRLRGFTTRRNANIGGSLRTGRNARIIDIRCEDGNNHCIQHQDGCYLENVTASECYYLLDTPTHFVCYEDAPIGLGSQYVNCTAEQAASVTAYGFYAHNTSGSFGTITYDDCTVTNILRGFSAGTGAGQLVINDPTYTIGSGGTPLFCNSAVLAEINGGTYSGLLNLVRFTNTGDNSVVETYDVTAVCSADVFSGAGAAANVSVHFEDCNFTESGGGTAAIALLGDTPTIYSRGTAFATGGAHRYYYTDGVTALDSDFNAFSGNKGFRIGGVNYADIGAYRVALQQDMNSTPAPTAAPVLSGPVGTATGDDTADLSVTTTGSNGFLWWVVTTSATAPTAAQVKAGLNHLGASAADSGSQSVSGSGSQSISGGASGLSGSTTYYAHFMHENTSGSRSNVASGNGFTTDADAGAPTMNFSININSQLLAVLEDF